MDRIERIPELPIGILNQLDAWQAEIDGIGSFLDRRRQAKGLFSSKNRRNNVTFAEVRSRLKEMSPGRSRCVYCHAGELQAIEHFRPKAHFPEHTFAWENYLYSCEHCNRAKRDHFCVYYPKDGEPDWYRFPAKEEVPQLVRDRMPALLNPRCEDPLDYLRLDLSDTFNFLPRHRPGTVEHYRARYTIDLLQLNVRDFLTQAREIAFDAYCSHLESYVNGNPDGKSKIAKIIHTAVWREMKRQSLRKGSELAGLFNRVPEARGW